MPDLNDADDLLQNVAVVMLRKFRDYDQSRPFLHWALGIARNEALGHRRARARSAQIALAPDVAEVLAEATEEVASEMAERLRHLKRCQDALQPRAREVLRLRYADALDPRLIAEKLAMSYGAVRVALRRARQALLDGMERGRARP